MKFNIFFLALLTAICFRTAHGSGCGHYDDFRIVSFRSHPSMELYDMSRSNQKYELLTLSPDKAEIRDVKSAEIITLLWSQSEKIEPGTESRERTSLLEQDVIFEEGNGCGPTYECATAYIKISHYDLKTGKKEIYHYPEIAEFRSPDRYFPRWISDQPLLPLILTTTQNPGDGTLQDHANPQQCRYGYW